MHQSIIDFINNFLKEHNSTDSFNGVFIDSLWESEPIDSYSDELFYYSVELIEVELVKDYVFVRLIRNNYSVSCDGDLLDTDILEEYSFRKDENINA